VAEGRACGRTCEDVGVDTRQRWGREKGGERERDARKTRLKGDGGDRNGKWDESECDKRESRNGLLQPRWL